MVYNKIMKFNESNVVIDDVLTESQIANLYEAIENSNETRQPNDFAQTVSDFDLPEEVAKSVISYSELISGEPGLEISEYQFARYKNTFDPESGEAILPNLIPHWDSAFEEPRFTFDYQLGGNTTWPLVVENKKFTLQNNSALTFSGTHQIHWRSPKIFAENEYIDMVFFHLRKIESAPYENDLSFVMYEKEKKYALQYENEDK
jgi:hypothetical protein